MKFLLDTNVCIAVMRGQAAAVSRLSARAPGECAVSAVTAYELFTGVAKCREPEREHGKVMRLLSAGQVCGPYDLLLAGHALALGLTPVTNNVREFSRVSGLGIEDWLA